MSEILNTLRDAATDVKNLVTHPEILFAITATQVACEGHFSSTANVTDMACAQEMMSRDDDLDHITGSNRIGLSANGYVGYTRNEDGLLCIVKSYTAWDPSTLENLNGYDVDELLEENLIAMTFNGSDSFERAYNKEELGVAYLADNAADFDLSTHDDHGGNVFAAVCPTWEGPSELVVTDLCRYIVGIDGKSTDSYPDVPECLETHYPDVNYCED